jgi:hypothetical protein
MNVTTETIPQPKTQRITLFYRQGNSDKVFHLSHFVGELLPGGHVVNRHYPDIVEATGLGSRASCGSQSTFASRLNF